MLSTKDQIRAMLSNNKTEQQQLSAQLNNNSSNSDPAEELKKMLESMQSALWDSSVIQDQITTTTIGSSLQPGPPLTAAEEKELKDLEVQRVLDHKRAKLDYFKKLPKEFRQQVINRFMWDDAVKDMDNIPLLKSDREAELETKRALSGNPFIGSFRPSFGGGISSLGYDNFMPVMGSPPLPVGITKEDLLQAHLDASLEEEISEG